MFNPEIKFIGESPKDKDAYLKCLNLLLDEVIEGDPGEAGEEDLYKSGVLFHIVEK